jgi:hypothetical protein
VPGEKSLQHWGISSCKKQILSNIEKNREKVTFYVSSQAGTLQLMVYWKYRNKKVGNTETVFRQEEHLSRQMGIR